MGRELVDKLLYEFEEMSEITDAINSIDDEETLYEYTCNYNWDDGFEIPSIILKNKSCSLSIAMRIFFDGDGVTFLFDSENKKKEAEWYKFESDLYKRIVNGVYTKGTTEYINPLSRIEKFKLSKTDINKIFLDGKF